MRGPQPSPRQGVNPAIPALPRWREWSSRGWPVPLLALLTLLFLSRLVLSSWMDILATPDIEQYFFWLHGYTATEFTAGRIPLWNPHNYAGIPFAANPQCSVFYPLSWLHVLMPVGHAEKWMIILHVFLGGAFLYLFLRRVGLERLPAFAACLPWSFGSYSMANSCVGHLTMLFTAAWLPLVMYAYERALQSGRVRWLVWTGLALGMQVLAGEPQNSYYTVLLLVLYGVLRTVLPRDDRDFRVALRRAGGLAIVGVVAMLTSAIQLLPTLEMMLQSDRTVNSYEFATNRSMGWGALVSYLLPWSGDFRGVGTSIHGRFFFAELNWEFACYVGIITLVMAGLSFAVRGRPALYAAWLLLPIAFVLMLGMHTPGYRVLLDYVPGLRLFRFPARARLIALWCLTVMSGFGLQWLLADAARWRGKWRTPVSLVLLISAAVVLVTLGCFEGVKLIPNPGDFWKPERIPLRFWEPFVLKPAACLALTAVVLWLLPRLGGRAGFGIVLLLGVDLLLARPDFPLRTFSPEVDQSLQVLTQVASRNQVEGLYRVDLAPSQVNANVAMAAGAEDVNGYWPVALRRFYRYVHAMRGQQPPRLERHEIRDDVYTTASPFLKLLNVRFASAARSGSSVPDDIVEDKDCLPRAWIADRVEVIPDEDGTLKRLLDPAFDPARSVLLEKPPAVPLAAGQDLPGSCEIKPAPQGGLNIATQSAREGYLVVSHIFYPGWHARIDGVEAPLERADYLITAMRLPAGKHKVELRYEPLSFKLGALGTSLACLGALAMVVWRVVARRAIRSERATHF